jgi:DNA-binding transcriptional ArsR family regulator
MSHAKIRKAAMHSDGGGAASYEFVPVSELDDATVEVTIAPFESVFVQTIDALTRGGLGSRVARDRPPASPTEWRSAVLSRLRARDVKTLRPLVDPRTLAWPSCISSTQSRAATMGQVLEQLAEVPGDELTAAILGDSAVDRRAPEAWLPVLRAPERWMRRYVEALHRAWLGFEPLWRRSTPLLEREAERVAAAAARGATVTLVDALHPYSSIANGDWRLFERSDPVQLQLDDHRLVVAPLLAESVCMTDCDDAGGLRMLSYPLPGVWRAFDAQAPPPASLEALVGIQRAAMLQALERPATAGRLAELLQVVPSGVTHHVRALESAGLVARERRGSHVIVERTARGTALLELYEHA